MHGGAEYAGHAGYRSDPTTAVDGAVQSAATITQLSVGGASSTLTKYPGIASAALWFLVFQTPTHPRLDRIRGLVECGARTPQALAFLGFRGWAEVLEPDAILDFLAALRDVDVLAEVRLHLSLALLERELEPEQRETVVEQLGRTLRRCRRSPSGHGPRGSRRS